MLKFFALALVAVLTFTAQTAMADSTGFFIAGGANYAEIDSSIEDDLDLGDGLEALFDDSAAGYNLGAGYRFNNSRFRWSRGTESPCSRSCSFPGTASGGSPLA